MITGIDKRLSVASINNINKRNSYINGGLDKR